MIDFLFVIIELFCYLLQLSLYKRQSVEVGVFQRGWITAHKFQTEWGGRPLTTVGVRKRVIALSYGIKISAVHCLILCVTDRQTDRITTANITLA